LAWLLTEFLGRPFRAFFDLRNETIRRLVQYDNVRARQSERQAQSESVVLTRAEEARLTEAEDTFRDLASRMRAFAAGEAFACWAVGILGYDAMKISSDLIGFSNTVGTYGQTRHDFRSRLETTLKFHTP
jgi:hypothetical protein